MLRPYEYAGPVDESPGLCYNPLVTDCADMRMYCELQEGRWLARMGCNFAENVVYSPQNVSQADRQQP
jgi:hypothetical protein